MVYVGVVPRELRQADQTVGTIPEMVWYGSEGCENGKIEPLDSK
ncbi:MAG: hypothetical protein NPIRA05_17440 [Nitrospirales bacterium]|nr:MAG: hypothetical protein NPIRA05_17440 [Nitrospirales bacterium]